MGLEMICTSIAYEICKYGPKMTESDDLEMLYKMHDELTDKKILGTITPDEEDILGQIRTKLDDKDLITSLNMQIEKYEEILEKLKSLKGLISK